MPPDPLTAALQQLAGHSEQITALTGQLAELTGLIAQLTPGDAGPGRYQPGPAPPWWKLPAADRAERDLTGSRDLAAVLDARIRYRLGTLIPRPGPWSAQVPAITDSARRAYAAQIAALMDARKDRIGQHTAEHELPWAVAAPGPVPADPAARPDWQKKASAIGAWRELSGYRAH